MPIAITLTELAEKQRERGKAFTLCSGCTILEIVSPTMGYPQFQRTVSGFYLKADALSVDRAMSVIGYPLRHRRSHVGQGGLRSEG
jgi:hypothetical protein